MVHKLRAQANFESGSHLFGASCVVVKVLGKLQANSLVLHATEKEKKKQKPKKADQDQSLSRGGGEV